MNKYVSRSRKDTCLNLFFWVLIVFWTLAVAVSLWWALAQREQTLKIAATAATALLEKDLLYGRWGSKNGGVCIPVAPKTPVNPYLPSLAKPEADATSSGLYLTLVNPDHMMRHIYELAKESGQPQGRITSRRPHRPENAPDTWEEQALKAFEQGKTEFSSINMVGGQAYLRMMHPIITEARCLGCHEEQGYRVGNVRGGISVAVPMAPLWQAARPLTIGLWWGHGLLWLLGLGGILFGFNRLRLAHDRIVNFMFTDPLTGIGNRRLFLECLAGAMSFAQRHQAPVSILMADLDDFKSVNDTFGHDAGDQVLQAFAILLVENSRQEDLLARFGGDEFIMMLPGTATEEATILGERLRRLWGKMTFHDSIIRLTASFGVSTYQPGDTIDSLIKRADQALYKAKKLGKNRVIIREDRPEKTEKMARKLPPLGEGDFSPRATHN